MSGPDPRERERLGSPVDALTRLFAIVGHPIDHVRAPVVWSALFRRYGVNAVFLPAEVEPAKLDEALRGLKALANVGGLMLTMPHKIAALRSVDRVSERARRVGSINLMRREADGSWSGDNVDGAGFVLGLEREGVAIAGRHVYVHGAGGVGANIAWSLAAEPIARLTVFDIDAARAADLAGRIGRETGKPVAAGTPDWPGVGLAVNASPLGLLPDDPLPFDVTALAEDAAVADVVMEPYPTALLEAAAARGLVTHHGRHMMNYAMPLAAAYFGLDTRHDWNGGPLQNT